MLITQLKPRDSILSMAEGRTVVINCEGCREIRFEDETAGIIEELVKSKDVMITINADYICNPVNLRIRLKKYMDMVNEADTVLVFSCGVGAQTVAGFLAEKKVRVCCDTYPLPGVQGLTPMEYDCGQCGECYLNDTGGICPITACSKSLINGQCGGAKNGKCEVDKDMDCGWERILMRLKGQNTAYYPVRVRNYAADILPTE